MTLYTVHAPPEAAGGGGPDPTLFVFVKEGFCWPALVVPEIWLIVRGMWLVLALYVAILILMMLGAAQFSGSSAPLLVILLARLLFALEANGLRRWTLERRGFALAGVVEAPNREEAELRFFAEYEAPAAAAKSDEPPVPPPPAPPQPRNEPWRPTPEDGGVVGLFPAPGGGR